MKSIAKCLDEVGYLHLRPHIHFERSLQLLIQNIHIVDSLLEPNNQVQCGLILDIVVREDPLIFQLFPCEYKPLDIGRNTLCVVYFILHILDG